MEIIRPKWKEKSRNIEILIQYLAGERVVNMMYQYDLSRSRIMQIVKIQLKELFQRKDYKFNCVYYKGDKDAISMAEKYKNFLKESFL